MEGQLVYTLNILWDIIKNWWWLGLPFVLWRPFSYFWLYWRAETWMLRQKMVLLEVKMPKEVLKPLRAMEQVFFTRVWPILCTLASTFSRPTSSDSLTATVFKDRLKACFIGMRPR